jgi:hypothetical protein
MNFDFTEYVIRPEFCNSGFYNNITKRYLNEDQTVITSELFNRIVNLNNRYLRFASMTNKSKKLFFLELYLLDVEGCKLRDELSANYGFQVKYFSEGLLDFIPTYPDLALYPKVSMNCFNSIRKKIVLYFSTNTYGQYP